MAPRLGRLMAIVVLLILPTAARAQEATPPLAPEPRGLGWQWYAFSVGGQVSDAWSTRRFRALGINEANHAWWGLWPAVVDRPALFYAIKTGIGWGLARLGAWIDLWAQRHGPRWLRHVGRALPLISGSLGIAATVHNERRILRHCRATAAVVVVP
jgi:hypothetical protein